MWLDIGIEIFFAVIISKLFPLPYRLARLYKDMATPNDDFAVGTA